MVKFKNWSEIFIPGYESGKFASMSKNEKCVLFIS